MIPHEMLGLVTFFSIGVLLMMIRVKSKDILEAPKPSNIRNLIGLTVVLINLIWLFVEYFR